MPSVYGIKPIASYQQYFTGTHPEAEQSTSTVNEMKHDTQILDIPTDKVGTTSSKVARKGVKYLWHKFTDYLSGLFHNKDADEKIETKYNYEA